MSKNLTVVKLIDISSGMETKPTSIWKLPPSLEDLNPPSHKTIHQTLGIKFTRIGDQFLEATLPVDHRTVQPMGLLHGGASAVLAESLGSVASLLVVGPKQSVVGIEINASHLRGVRSGHVLGRVTPARLGKSVHVWDIRIYHIEEGHPILSGMESPDGLPEVCRSRLTVMIREAK